MKDNKIEDINHILDVITIINQATNEEEIRKCIPELLEYIGMYSLASHVCFFELVNGFKKTYEWSYEDALEFDFIAFEKLPVWYEQFSCGKTILIQDIEDIKENMPLEYRALKNQGVHSVICAPLFANKRLSGFIGLQDPDLSDSQISMMILSNICGHIANAMNTIRMVNVLETNLLQMQKEKQILEALCSNYTSTFVCDLKNDTFETLKQDPKSNGDDKIEMVDSSFGYTSRMKYYYDHYVIHESAPDFLEKLDRLHLMEVLKKSSQFLYLFRSKPNATGNEYFEVHVHRLQGDNGFKVIMGFRSIDDLVKEDIKKQIQMETMMDQLRLNNEIISAISKMYWLMYRMNLNDDTFEEISSEESVYRLTGKTGITSIQLQKFREKFVADEFQDVMKEFLDTSTLIERLNDREDVSIEYESTTGKWHFACFIVKARNFDGTVRNVLYVTRDINKQKIQELEGKEELKRTVYEAKKANLAKTDFLRRMSHDIRTPINGIQGCLEIGDRYSENMEIQKEIRSKIKTASGYLLNLVNDVLDMNKLESGNIVLENKSFDLGKLLDDTNDMIFMQASEAGISCSKDMWKIEHRYVLGSPLHFQQVLMNIGGNAVKYNQENGSIRVTCQEISCDDSVAWYELTCTDTGIGMSEEFQKNAYEPFAQEKSSARSKYVGTGLGLAIAKKMIELQGGSISFESKLNVGTTFIIRVPFEIDYSVQEETCIIEKPSVEGLRVLLVEDNELNMEIASFLLEEQKMIVTQAYNGLEALEIFSTSQEFSFDVILMDVMMPKMGGLEATRRIRSLERKDANTIPIFAMTANAFVDDIERTKKAGMNEHFSKPLAMEKVIEAIGNYSKKITKI